MCVCERSKVYDEIVIALGDSKNRLELPTMFPDVVLRNSVGYLPTARAGESIPPISGFAGNVKFAIVGSCKLLY